MANSLRAKLSKLRHDGNITDAEYKALIKKLDGHDMEIYGLGYNQGTIDRAEEVTKAREQGYAKGIDDFYDNVLNFEDYIEPIDTSEFGAVLLYSGNDITNMIVKIKEEMRGAK